MVDGLYRTDVVNALSKESSDYELKNEQQPSGFFCPLPQPLLVGMTEAVLKTGEIKPATGVPISLPDRPLQANSEMRLPPGRRHRG